MTEDFWSQKNPSLRRLRTPFTKGRIPKEMREIGVFCYNYRIMIQKVLRGIVIIAALGIIFLLASVVASFTKNKTFPVVPVPQAVFNTSSSTPTTDFKKDSDNDGLKDWEEELWKTDPLKADTDGDGTSDGDEIKAGRDPITKGPGDFLTAGTQTLAPKTETPPPFSSPTPIRQPATLTDNSVASSINTEKELVRTFGNNAGALFKKNLPDSLVINDIFTRVVKNPDASALADLSKLADTYRSFAEKLSVLTPPESASLPYRTLQKSYAALADAIASLVGSTKDGKIEAQSFVTYYSDPAVAVTRALVAFMQYFKENGVVFSRNEEGYIFNISI